MPNWREEASEEAKRETLGAVRWSQEVDTYLWYEIGDVSRLTKDEIGDIVAENFVSKVGFGDVELHRSAQLPGGPTLLRLRGTLRLRPSLTLRGRYCPLYQVGHGSDADCVNFHDLWGSTPT